MRRFLFLLLFALAFPVRAAAQVPPADAAPPTPGQIASARELVGLIRMQETAAIGVKTALDQQIAANPAMAQFRGVMEQWATRIFSSEEAVQGFAEVYAATFSEAELREIVAFYRTPVGQRLASSQAELARRGAEVGRRLAAAHMSELLNSVQDKLGAGSKP